MPQQPASVAVGLSGPRLAAALAVMSPASRPRRIAMHAPPPDTWKRPPNRGCLQPGQHRKCRFTHRAGIPRPAGAWADHPSRGTAFVRARRGIARPTAASTAGRASQPPLEARSRAPRHWPDGVPGPTDAERSEAPKVDGRFPREASRPGFNGGRPAVGSGLRGRRSASPRAAVGVSAGGGRGLRARGVRDLHNLSTETFRGGRVRPRMPHMRHLTGSASIASIVRSCMRSGPANRHRAPPPSTEQSSGCPLFNPPAGSSPGEAGARYGPPPGYRRSPLAAESLV